MDTLNHIIDFLSTPAGQAIVLALVGWLSVYIPTKNREQLDRATKLAFHYIEQMKRQGAVTDKSDAITKAVEAARASLPMAVSMLTTDAAIIQAIEAHVGAANVGKSAAPGETQGAGTQGAACCAPTNQ